MIVVSNVEKKFDKQRALKNISVTFEQGKTTAIIGSSGSGKTTLLRCLNLLEMPDSGTITLADHRLDFSSQKKVTAEEIVRFRRKTGMVFQSFNLFPHLSALDNVTEGMVTVKKQTKAEAHLIARELLVKVGLSDKEKMFPHQLSGGQQQRVAIARAMALNPEVLLFDEPTSALDPELVGEVLAVIKDLAVAGMTMIIVTHEMRFAEEVADHILFFDQGEILDQGSAEHIFHQSTQARLQQFLNKLTH